MAQRHRDHKQFAPENSRAKPNFHSPTPSSDLKIAEKKKTLLLAFDCKLQRRLIVIYQIRTVPFTNGFISDLAVIYQTRMVCESRPSCDLLREDGLRPAYSLPSCDLSRENCPSAQDTCKIDMRSSYRKSADTRLAFRLQGLHKQKKTTGAPHTWTRVGISSVDAWARDSIRSSLSFFSSSPWPPALEDKTAYLDIMLRALHDLGDRASFFTGDANQRLRILRTRAPGASSPGCTCVQESCWVGEEGVGIRSGGAADFSY